MIALNKFMELADKFFDGHATILKFTTNWRAGFGTVDEYAEMQILASGESMEGAITKATGELEACGFDPDFYFSERAKRASTWAKEEQGVARSRYLMQAPKDYHALVMQAACAALPALVKVDFNEIHPISVAKKAAAIGIVVVREVEKTLELGI